jgi:hypothetical protein
VKNKRGGLRGRLFFLRDWSIFGIAIDQFCLSFRSEAEESAFAHHAMV